MTDNSSFTLIGEDRTSRYVILCDHASNRVPPDIANGDLGLAPEDMARHIAYDVGAAGVSVQLGELLNAPVLLSNFSRLVIDPNRSEDDPTLIMQLYDGSIIPGNRNLSQAERNYRIETYHRPYRLAAENFASRHENPILVAIHSFTPMLNGRRPRPWEVGVLYAQDRRFSDPLIAAIEAGTGNPVGRNQPYTGALEGDMMDVIGLRQNRLHALLEIRNDLISCEGAQSDWAKSLARYLEEAAADL